jgi:DNA-binding NarL/FixJ family response regulator
MEVLRLMADGLDNRAIADRLSISFTTVRGHVQHILEKLDAHSKLEAVARAAKYALLSK